MNYDNNNNNFNNTYNMNQGPMFQPMQQMPNNQPNGNLYDFSNDINNNVSNNGYSNENVEFKSSKKKRFSFFALLEFLIIVFLCLYIANDKGYIHIKYLDNLIPAKEQKQEEPKEESKTAEAKKEETTVTDYKTTAEFKLRAYYLGNVGVSFEKLISPIFLKDTKASDLTAADRLYTILMGALTVENKYESLTDAQVYQELFPDLASNSANDMSVIKVIDSSFIESRYKLVFGEEPTNTNLEDTCPHFVYSDKYKKYYINPYCGNTIVNESINQFAYDVKTDGEKFYVYVSVASYKQNEDNTYSVYRDPELKEKYQDFATEEEYSKFEVNNSNHNEFSKYKVTFVKVNDEYAFESFEKYTEEGSKGLDTKEQ